MPWVEGKDIVRDRGQEDLLRGDDYDVDELLTGREPLDALEVLGWQRRIRKLLDQVLPTLSDQAHAAAVATLAAEMADAVMRRAFIAGPAITPPPIPSGRTPNLDRRHADILTHVAGVANEHLALSRRSAWRAHFPAIADATQQFIPLLLQRGDATVTVVLSAEHLWGFSDVAESRRAILQALEEATWQLPDGHGG